MKLYAYISAFLCIAFPITLALLTNDGYTFSDNWFCYGTLFWFFLSGIFYGLHKISKFFRE